MDNAAGADHPVRAAGAADAPVVAALLDDFNREFGCPTPGPAVLAERLRRLLPGPDVAALLTGAPAVGVAVVSFRANVWYDGPVALLDELYVRPDLRGRRHGHSLLQAACALARERGADVLEINVDGGDTAARRFYEAHGFRNVDEGATEPMFYYYRTLTGDAPPR
ncbi:MAG TPA: GNAT family N-acetyltransferase [Pilimelia sp.]|nr:GNAT family N-acetyltransferase [Pilimelia sp.]